MPAALEHLAQADAPAPVADPVGLRGFLGPLPDPRDRRGRRYPLRALLCAAAASVLAGARSLTAIGEWIADAPRWALRACGFAPDPLTGHVPVPPPATVRRLLARLDGDALDEAIGAFLTARARRPAPAAGTPPGAAGDRDRRQDRARLAHPRPARDRTAGRHGAHRRRARPAPGRRQEQRDPRLRPAAGHRGPGRCRGHADALHTQHDHATYLRSRGAHYLAIVKKNHPTLYDRVRQLPWRDIALDHYARTRAHHRMEIRRPKTAAFAHLDYPDAAQALQVVRWRRESGTGKLTIERVYLITSLAPGEATDAQLAAWIRGHWGIENLLHHVRDRTYREDDSKIRTGNLPRTMASLRNLAISVHRQRPHQHRRRPPPHRPRLPTAPANPRPRLTNPDRTSSCKDPAPGPDGIQVSRPRQP